LHFLGYKPNTLRAPKALLDAPGEYFIEESSATLFFIPPRGADPSGRRRFKKSLRSDIHLNALNDSCDRMHL
jgi:hypothetical protein